MAHKCSFSELSCSFPSWTIPERSCCCSLAIADSLFWLPLIKLERSVRMAVMNPFLIFCYSSGRMKLLLSTSSSKFFMVSSTKICWERLCSTTPLSVSRPFTAKVALFSNANSTVWTSLSRSTTLIEQRYMDPLVDTLTIDPRSLLTRISVTADS